MGDQSAKPLPLLDADNKPFWDACAAHRLVAQRCADCGSWRWPPCGVCPACRSWRAEWVGLSGHGVVSSFVIVHRPAHPGFADRLPYSVALVTLDGTGGGVVMVTNIDGCPPGEVTVGMAVRVVFHDMRGDFVLPTFVPAQDGPSPDQERHANTT